jgi:uncharacterized DUF497 family protein
VRFEWDRVKATTNIKKHKITFDEAVTVFYDPLSATFQDPDHSIGESRFITIGISSRGSLLVVSHTDKGEVIRIISARNSTSHERKQHEN